MADTTITTEQQVTGPIIAKDGRGRVKPIDGAPVVAVSDATVLTVVDPVQAADGTWNVTVKANGIAGVATVTVTADVDISPDVQDIIGSSVITVTLDPRTAARTVDINFGAPEDQP